LSREIVLKTLRALGSADLLKLDLQIFEMSHGLLVFFFKDFFFLLNYLKTSELGLTKSVGFHLGGLAVRIRAISSY
jgi:hypothetical protein